MNRVNKPPLGLFPLKRALRPWQRPFFLRLRCYTAKRLKSNAPYPWRKLSLELAIAPLLAQNRHAFNRFQRQYGWEAELRCRRERTQMNFRKLTLSRHFEPALNRLRPSTVYQPLLTVIGPFGWSRCILILYQIFVIAFSNFVAFHGTTLICCNRPLQTSDMHFGKGAYRLARV